MSWEEKSKIVRYFNLHRKTKKYVEIYIFNLFLFVLGLVGLIDAKGIGVAQPIWS